MLRILPLTGSLMFALWASPALAATIYFAAPATVPVGEAFSLHILVDSNDRAFNAGEASILFPNDVLEVVSVDNLPSSTIFNFWLATPSFSNEKGVVFFSGGTTHGVVGPSVQILSVHMRAKGKGEALITASDASVNASDGTGSNVLDAIKALRIAITEAPVIVPAPAKTAPKPASVPKPSAPILKEQCLGFFISCEFPFPTIKSVSVTPNRELGSDIFVSGTAEEGANVRLRLFRQGVLYKEIVTIVSAERKWEGVFSNIPAYGVYTVDAIAEGDGQSSQSATWTGIDIFPPYTLNVLGFSVRWYFIAEALIALLFVGWSVAFVFRTFAAEKKKVLLNGPVKVGLLVLSLAFIGMSIATYFLWNAEYNPPTVYWKNTDIPCIKRSHSFADVYGSAKIDLEVDGVRQTIPTEIGISPQCVAQIHTHDDIGNLHFEPLAEHPATLTDFFTVAGKPVERKGYSVSVQINGESHTEDAGSYVLHNGDVILVTYSSLSPRKK